MKNIVFVSCALLLYLVFNQQLQAQTLENNVVESLYAKISDLSQRIQKLEQELSFKEQELSGYALPERMTFCGEEIDLNRPDIREKIEEEWLLLLGNRQQIYLWQNQAIQRFPQIEAIAKKLNTCEELKFLSLLSENALTQEQNPMKNWWGLSVNVAKSYGLNIDQYIDERADLSQSTELTLQALKSLRLEFSSWSLALVAHQIGVTKLNQLINTQSTSEFWDLDIENQAVEKQILRLLVVKELMTHLKHYHFIPKKKKGASVSTVKLLIPAKKKFQGNLIKLSLFLSIPIKQLKGLNPSIIDILPPSKPFTLTLPIELKDQALAIFGLDQSFVIEQNSSNIQEPMRSTQQLLEEQIKLAQTELPKEQTQQALPEKASQQDMMITTNTTELLKDDADRMPKDDALAQKNQIPSLEQIPSSAPADQEPKQQELIDSASVKQTTSADPKTEIQEPQPSEASAQQEIKVVEVFKGSQLKHPLTPNELPPTKPLENQNAVLALGKVTQYVVKNGDSFWKIARKFSVTPEEIKAWNDIKNDQIQAGQSLKIYKSQANTQK